MCVCKCRHSEAEPLYRQALELWQRTVGPEHPDTLTSIVHLALCIQDVGRCVRVGVRVRVRVRVRVCVRMCACLCIEDFRAARCRVG